MVIHMVHQQVEDAAFTLEQKILKSHLLVLVKEALDDFVEVSTENGEERFGGTQELINKLVKQTVVYLFLRLFLSFFDNDRAFFSLKVVDLSFLALIGIGISVFLGFGLWLGLVNGGLFALGFSISGLDRALQVNRSKAGILFGVKITIKLFNKSFFLFIRLLNIVLKRWSLTLVFFKMD